MSQYAPEDGTGAVQPRIEEYEYDKDNEIKALIELFFGTARIRQNQCFGMFLVTVVGVAQAVFGYCMITARSLSNDMESDDHVHEYWGPHNHTGVFELPFSQYNSSWGGSQKIKHKQDSMYGIGTVLVLIFLAVLFTKDLVEVFIVGFNTPDGEGGKCKIFGVLYWGLACIVTWALMLIVGLILASSDDIGASVGTGLGFYIIAQIDDWVKDVINASMYIEIYRSYNQCKEDMHRADKLKCFRSVPYFSAVGSAGIGILAWMAGRGL